MDAIKAIDKASFIESYLKLMWCVHSKYEGLTMEQMVLYRLGMQTFMEHIEENLKELINALNSDEED